MGRPLRASEGGWVYHVLNRANARLPIFEKPADYEASERILAEGVERYGAEKVSGTFDCEFQVVNSGREVVPVSP